MRIAPQSSYVVGNLVFAAKQQEPQYDTRRLLFTITFAIAVLVHGVIERASKEKDESLGRSPRPWILLGGAISLLSLGYIGGSLGVGWLVTLVVAILLLQVGLDVYVRLQ